MGYWPVAKQVFPDTAGSAMNRTTASPPGASKVVRERDGIFGGLGVHPLYAVAVGIVEGADRWPGLAGGRRPRLGSVPV